MWNMRTLVACAVCLGAVCSAATPAAPTGGDRSLPLLMRLAFDERPFVVLKERAYVDLGTLEGSLFAARDGE